MSGMSCWVALCSGGMANLITGSRASNFLLPNVSSPTIAPNAAPWMSCTQDKYNFISHCQGYKCVIHVRSVRGRRDVTPWEILVFYIQATRPRACACIFHKTLGFLMLHVYLLLASLMNQPPFLGEGWLIHETNNCVRGWSSMCVCVFGRGVVSTRLTGLDRTIIPR